MEPNVLPVTLKRNSYLKLITFHLRWMPTARTRRLHYMLQRLLIIWLWFLKEQSVSIMLHLQRERRILRYPGIMYGMCLLQGDKCWETLVSKPGDGVMYLSKITISTSLSSSLRRFLTGCQIITKSRVFQDFPK